MKTTITLIKLTTTIATIVTQMAIINAADLTVEVKDSHNQTGVQQTKSPNQIDQHRLVVSNAMSRLEKTKDLLDKVLQNKFEPSLDQIDQALESLRTLVMKDLAEDGSFIQQANILSGQITDYMSTIDQLLNESLHPHDRQMLRKDRRELSAHLENLANDIAKIREMRTKTLQICSFLETKRKIIAIKEDLNRFNREIEKHLRMLETNNDEALEKLLQIKVNFPN